MRKLVWAGTAMVGLGAAAVYLAADYAAHHPDSWIGRCTTVAGYLGSKCNPLGGLAAAVSHHPAADEEALVCDAGKEAKSDDLPDVPEAVADAAEGEVNEPIKVEPQPGFIMPFDPVEFPQAVPASEETPEPRFGAGEESEVPTEVAAPAHEDLQNVPPPMPYAEDDPPACKTCGACPEGCRANGTCAKDCDKGDCAKRTCKQGDGPTTSCAQCCRDWFMSMFGHRTCGKCRVSKPTATQPVAADPAATSECPARNKPTSDSSEVPAPNKPTSDSSNDDVPNCQEDPSYSHQYPSCPYTGSPTGICPFPHPATTAPETSPLEEVMPPRKKVKKPDPTSLLLLPPQRYGSLLDPLARGAGSRTVSSLRALKMTTGVECEVHFEVDTMEARPTDVDQVPSSEEPF